MTPTGCSVIAAHRRPTPNVLPIFGAHLSASIYPAQKILLIDVLRVVDNIVTLPINTENIRGSQGGGSSALRLLETVGLVSWKSEVVSFALGVGMGSGDNCSTGRKVEVETPYQCPQFTFATARPWETSAA